MQDDILDLAYEVSKVTKEKIDLIDSVMRQTNLLAINARIEAARAGTSGAAFSVVAQEMGAVASEITRISKELRGAISSNIERLEKVGAELLQRFRGTRYADLSLNAIEIIDRNLYERSCDVRWWATDSAVVNALENGAPETIAYATSRLETILRSYTVYIDLWIADASGRIVATGRPGRYSRAVGLDVSGAAWFRNAMSTRSGDEFVVSDIEANTALEGAAVATYSTAIRRGGAANGRAIGALGIFFDWAPQAEAVVKGVGLSEEERGACRVMLLDAKQRVIASSDGVGLLREHFALPSDRGERGYFIDGDRLIAYALTPGYETYRGLGWYGVIEAKLEENESAHAQGGVTVMTGAPRPASPPPWTLDEDAAPSLQRKPDWPGRPQITENSDVQITEPPQRAMQAGVPTIFDVLGWEIELAGARCVLLDSIMGEMLKCLPEDKQRTFMQGLHTVDLLSQQLSSLSSFSHAISANVPADVFARVETALGDVTLGALADRMTVALGGAEKTTDDGTEAGEVDLF